MKRKFLFPGHLWLLTVLAVLLLAPAAVRAASLKEIDTGIRQQADAIGRYSNWDGVPAVSTFRDEDGQFAFAFRSSAKRVTVVKTENGKAAGRVTLKMKGTLFGAVTCDRDGYLYVVSGTENTGSDTSKKTIFVSKYTQDGQLVKAVGNDGSSSLASYYDASFRTREPFDAGTCDVAVNGDYLAVNYGRKMYSGHQSNSVWIIRCSTMRTVKPDMGEYQEYSNYESHSFGQRVRPYKGGFVFMSEGDCFDRAFVFSSVDLKKKTASEASIFDFWVRKNTYNDWDMYTLNNNFARIGDINVLNNGNVSFVASSVKSMSEKALKEPQQIFIQIFNPGMDLHKASAYATKGKRSGVAGKNGDEEKTNYGVKWLTKFSSGYSQNVQAVTDGKGNTIILYDRFNSSGSYTGVYCMVVNAQGAVVKKAARISKTALLNPCESPVYTRGSVYWCGNKSQDYTYKLYVYRLKL